MIVIYDYQECFAGSTSQKILFDNGEGFRLKSFLLFFAQRKRLEEKCTYYLSVYKGFCGEQFDEDLVYL